MKLKQRDICDQELAARLELKPGMFLYGYCGGRFGRDSFGDKEIVSVDMHSLVVREDGVLRTSFDIDSWVDLIKSSNDSIEREEN